MGAGQDGSRCRQSPRVIRCSPMEQLRVDPQKRQLQRSDEQDPDADHRSNNWASERDFRGFIGLVQALQDLRQALRTPPDPTLCLLFPFVVGLGPLIELPAAREQVLLPRLDRRDGLIHLDGHRA